MLSRQKLPVLDASKLSVAEGVSRGAYVLGKPPSEKPELVLVGTGSEVQLVLAAQEKLAKQDIWAQVVSMPCVELFREQPPDYREQVLPTAVPKLVVEAGVPHGWREVVGEPSDVIGLERFGASAPAEALMKHLGFTVEAVVARARALIKR